MKALLDTDACIEIIRGNPSPLELRPEAVFAISSVTRFEILSGLRDQRKTKREKRARDFLAVVEVMSFDDAAADRSAEVRVQLELKGTPIGAYDLLIAGHALALGFPLVTGNQREFGRIEGLQLITWQR